VSDAVQRSLLANVPDVVVSTPARAWHSTNSSALSLNRLQHLVLDEADLVLSYGYDEDMENISRALPKGVQTVMMSATLSAELDALKGIFCRNPTLLDLKEEFGAEDEKLTQFYVKYVTEGGSGWCLTDNMIGAPRTTSGWFRTLSSSCS